MSAAPVEDPRDTAPQRNSVFQKLLLSVAERAVRAPVLAVGLAGSAQIAMRADASQDIDLIVVSDLAYHSRLRVVTFGRTLDIFQETPDSIAGELAFPRRAAFLRLLAGARALHDTGGLLGRSIEQASEMLRGPAPPSIFRTEFELSEPARDLAERHRRASGPVRALLRAALLERVVELAYVRGNLWPVPLHRSVEELAVHDIERAARLARAIEGDDAQLHGLVDALAHPATVARYGSRTRVSRRPVRPPRIGEPAQRPRIDVRKLAPPALARLSADRIATLSTGELESLSKLQLLTIQRIHAAVLSDAQLECIVARVHA